jgi:predicted short-subunit dehydrogenase-like oxidoreductase (DUF2520 family)
MGIGIVGAGPMGQAMARRLASLGEPPGLIFSRTLARAATLAGEIGWELAGSAGELVARSPLTLLAVPDSELERLVGELALELEVATPPQLRVVAHCAGVVGPQPLFPLRKLGCAVAVFHPLAPVPDGDPSCLDHTYVSIEAAPGAREQLQALALRLGCRSFLLENIDRPLYHAAAVFAGVLPVLVESIGERLALEAGAVEEVVPALRSLLAASARNVQRLGPQRGLSGPQRRRDSGTVDLHLEALDWVDPALGQLYTSIHAAARQSRPTKNAEES